MPILNTKSPPCNDCCGLALFGMFNEKRGINWEDGFIGNRFEDGGLLNKDGCWVPNNDCGWVGAMIGGLRRFGSFDNCMSVSFWRGEIGFVLNRFDCKGLSFFIGTEKMFWIVDVAFPEFDLLFLLELWIKGFESLNKLPSDAWKFKGDVCLGVDIIWVLFEEGCWIVFVGVSVWEKSFWWGDLGGCSRKGLKKGDIVSFGLVLLLMLMLLLLSVITCVGVGLFKGREVFPKREGTVDVTDLVLFVILVILKNIMLWLKLVNNQVKLIMQ